MKQRLLTPYMTEQTGKTISHVTRVNSIGKSSKIIFPKKVISTLDLDWTDDYVEWRFETRNGKKIAIIQKLDILNRRKTTK